MRYAAGKESLYVLGKNHELVRHVVELFGRMPPRPPTAVNESRTDTESMLVRSGATGEPTFGSTKVENCIERLSLLTGFRRASGRGSSENAIDNEVGPHVISARAAGEGLVARRDDVVSISANRSNTKSCTMRRTCQNEWRKHIARITEVE